MPPHTAAPRAWIAVASADHVRRGRAGGFMQVCHGKAGPLRRVRPGDRIAYYSPSDAFRGGAPLRAFTALGRVAEGEPYQVEMTPRLRPWRRDVAWEDAHPMPIAPLLGRLALTSGKRNWGAPFRYGLVAVEPSDLDLVAEAMGVRLRGAAAA